MVATVVPPAVKAALYERLRLRAPAVVKIRAAVSTALIRSYQAQLRTRIAGLGYGTTVIVLTDPTVLAALAAVADTQATTTQRTYNTMLQNVINRLHEEILHPLESSIARVVELTIVHAEEDETSPLGAFFAATQDYNESVLAPYLVNTASQMATTDFVTRNNLATSWHVEPPESESPESEICQLAIALGDASKEDFDALGDDGFQGYEHPHCPHSLEPTIDTENLPEELAWDGTDATESGDLVTKAYNPDEARDETGKWTTGGGGAASDKTSEPPMTFVQVRDSVEQTTTGAAKVGRAWVKKITANPKITSFDIPIAEDLFPHATPPGATELAAMQRAVQTLGYSVETSKTPSILDEHGLRSLGTTPEDLHTVADGLTYQRHIWIDERLPQDARAHVLAHEVSHGFDEQLPPDGSQMTSGDALSLHMGYGTEMIAEESASVISRHFGLDSMARSGPYLVTQVAEYQSLSGVDSALNSHYLSHRAASVADAILRASVGQLAPGEIRAT